MRPFHVLHWMPDSRLHIFHGYREVIETVVWGLRSLGFEVTAGVNYLRPGATHIVFGAQLMDVAMLQRLPEGSIIYNLEQLRGLLSTGREAREFLHMAERFAIWDYSMLNVEVWLGEFGGRSVRHMPIGFAPILNRIPKAAAQDIDVLIYGAPSTSRLQVVRQLCDLGLSAMFFCGLYDDTRDALIARAKLVANVSSGQHSNIFSIVRVSYLLANRKAVVADIASVEADMAGAVKFAQLDRVADSCVPYVRDPELRQELEEDGFRAIERRDIRAFLAPALTGWPE